MGFLSGLKDRLTGGSNVMYSSRICSDCQQAEEFFRSHDIDIEIKKIEDEYYRQELEDRYGRVLVPTIIIKGEKFLGFEMNKEEIKQKLELD